MPKWLRSKRNNGPKKRDRRLGALNRLEEQTKDFGKKVVTNSIKVKHGKEEPIEEEMYSESQQKRIRKEITILKEKTK